MGVQFGHSVSLVCSAQRKADILSEPIELEQSRLRSVMNQIMSFRL
jgi:hypothetical protein